MRLIHMVCGVAVLIASSMAAWGQATQIQLKHAEALLGRLPEHTLPDQVTISPDGQRLAYVAPRGIKMIAVIDGQPSKPHEWIIRGHIGFTPDSRHVVYQIRRDGKALTVVDGVEGRPYEAVDYWICSSRGGRVAYVAKHQGRFVPVVDGIEGKAYDHARFGAVSASGRVALIVRIAGKDCLVVDGKEGRLFDLIDDVRISPDGSRVAYRAFRDGRDKCYMVIDGVPGKVYSEVKPACFSDDGSRVGYLAGPESQRVLVVDGQEVSIPNARPIDGPVFSPDGKRLACVIAKEGDTAAVLVDGAEGPAYDAIANVCFSPDGKRIAYIAQRGSRSMVVVDGVEHGQFDAVEAGSVAFSPDGRHVAWIAQRDHKQFIVVDGVESESYDRVLFGGKLSFADNHLIHAVGVRERQVQRTSENQVASLRRYDLFALKVTLVQN